MNEFKFYEVKIGRPTKGGSFQTFHTFIAKSIRPLYEVYRFYTNKYQGFTIEVNEIVELITEEIPDTSEKSKISELEKQVKSLSSQSFNYFSGTIRRDSFPMEIQELFKVLGNINLNYIMTKNSIIDKLKTFLRGKYPQTEINSISIEEFNHDSFTVPYTIRLLGGIKFTGNEI